MSLFKTLCYFFEDIKINRKRQAMPKKEIKTKFK